jgi:hypothetical protein
MRNIYYILAENLKKESFRRPKRRWEDHIKMILIGLEDVA